MEGFTRVLSQGYWLKLLDQPPANSKHLFCGPNSAKDAVCPNCRKPLLRFLSMDLSDAALQNVCNLLSHLDLFYCWSCNVAQDVFFYRLLPEGGVVLLKAKKGGQTKDFPYQNYPTSFPGKWAELHPIPSEDQATIITLNRADQHGMGLESQRSELAVPRTQVGGEPYLVQGFPPEEVACPSCKERMGFLASVSDDEGNGYRFADNPYAQVLYYLCSKCAIVGAYQQCD